MCPSKSVAQLQQDSDESTSDDDIDLCSEDTDYETDEIKERVEIVH